MLKELERLKLQKGNKGWKKWGPYVSERQWGTVREDYSVYGDTWAYISHDTARSRAYRWGEDGLGAISDSKCQLCLGLALWNHKDPILKERLFGLTGAEGNHGEDVKELYYYLDSSPTHSYMKMLYKYPIAGFPYEQLVSENNQRNREHDEFEVFQTGVFENNQFFDVFVEYAKVAENDILLKIRAINRSAEVAQLSVLPTIWFRNTWDWGYEAYQEKPHLKFIDKGLIKVSHKNLGDYYWHFEGEKESLFCENETNLERIFGKTNKSPFPKDGINNHVIHGSETVNPDKEGTKCSLWFEGTWAPGEEREIVVRLSDSVQSHPLEQAEHYFALRKQECNEYYDYVQTEDVEGERRNIQRQAYAGMLWNKQFYYFNMEEWLKGDPQMPFEFNGRAFPRNESWKHLYTANVLSMPDKWEYPWFAAWDLAFHTLTLARVDPDFAKRQLSIVLREYYMHPNGQIPAYEWNFSDVNPPVHAWATWHVYQIDKNREGVGDLVFLEKLFHKLLLNFTWWVNQKDEQGDNIFGGGFLGMDNIGVFDRNAQLPGMNLEQADATGWMAMYTLNMLRIACELALERPAYQDMASKFFEHFLHIAKAINVSFDGIVGLWDDEDEFYYDKINNINGEADLLKLRSLVGIVPLFAVEVIDEETLSKLPDFKRRMEWVLANKPDLASLISRWHEPGKGETHMLSLLRGHRMQSVLKRVFDTSEFLSDFGIRSMSKIYENQPFEFDINGETHNVAYTAAESNLSIMGGNSNWRGPIWFPLNYLIIDSLQKYFSYYGRDFEIELPTGSGQMVTLEDAALELSERLISIFETNSLGRKAVNNQNDLLDFNENFKDYYTFFEYFNGDNGAGLGASHQTGWTGLVADLIELTKKSKLQEN